MGLAGTGRGARRSARADATAMAGWHCSGNGGWILGGFAFARRFLARFKKHIPSAALRFLSQKGERIVGVNVTGPSRPKALLPYKALLGSFGLFLCKAHVCDGPDLTRRKSSSAHPASEVSRLHQLRRRRRGRSLSDGEVLGHERRETSYMRGDLLTKTRKLVKGLAKPAPKWLKAMEESVHSYPTPASPYP